VITSSLAAVVPKKRKNVSMILEMTRDGKIVHVEKLASIFMNQRAFPSYTDQS
jgi:hypothetical protein